MSYRPISDIWILARAKLKGGVKYYGAYPGGFPERARVIIGCALDTPLLHVCGGHARLYPYARGFGPLDKTMDLNPVCEPDFLMDCREKNWPTNIKGDLCGVEWGGILIDPPYSEPDAEKYPPGAAKYPSPNQLVQTAIDHLRIGYKVGILHYIWPQCPKNAIEVFAGTVKCGRNMRDRAFTVFEMTQ